MLKQEHDLPPDVEETIRESLPDINGLAELYRARYALSTAGVVPDHIVMTWACLGDLGDMFQNAVVALREALFDFAEHHEEGNGEALMRAVHYARYSFDYSVLLMSAASNHLASSMWHFEEEVGEPLGGDYKSSGGVYGAWSDRDTPPASLQDLRQLVENENWDAILEYRHQWVHRGMPVLRGEFKYGRRPLWREKGSVSEDTGAILFQATREGKVHRDVDMFRPDFDPQELFETGRKALVALEEVSRLFIERLDNHILESPHFEFSEKGNLKWKMVGSE